MAARHHLAPYLEVDQISKTFPATLGIVPWVRKLGRVGRRRVLDGVSFSVRRGELFGLLGTNGAGKSTILRIVAGLVVPDRGAVRVGGVEAPSGAALRRVVGLCCTDDRSFYYRLTARHNLEYFGALAGLDGKLLRERIAAVARAVDLGDDLDRRFDAFSSGMKQRLGIARALLGDPEILIFDEPTRAVDPAHAGAIRAFIRDELVGRRGKTVILATNLLEEAWELCERIAVLRGGRIATIAPPSELGARTGAPLRYAITIDRDEPEMFEEARALPGLLELRIEGDRPVVHLDVSLRPEPHALMDLLRVVSANGTCVSSVRLHERRPADIFADLVSGNADAR
jgi:ABC-2 type transport system ATP-binding protein